jgi:hypothetical protein
VEEVRASFVVNRCGRNTGLNQLDPPTVHDPVIRRGRDGHGPAKVMGDAKAHASILPFALLPMFPIRGPLWVMTRRPTFETWVMIVPVEQIDPVVVLARRLGLTVGKPVPLRSTNNVLVWLRPSMVVAKVSTRPGMAANELAIAKALALAGAPVVAPASEIGDCLYRVAGSDVTFWKYEPQDDSKDSDSRSIALALFELHVALDTLRSAMALPSYETQVVDAVHSLADQSFAPELPDEDRAVLLRALSVGQQRLSKLTNTDRIIHGSPHAMNILIVEGSPRFIDFETVQVGPIEWDIAHLEPAVGNSYPAPLDVDALALCSLMISAATSTWCWGGLNRGPDMRSHAEGHLAIVRSQLD